MTVESMKNRHQLMEFVRCAAKVIESKGFFGVGELMGERWRSGSVYVFGVDAKSACSSSPATRQESTACR